MFKKKLTKNIILKRILTWFIIPPLIIFSITIIIAYYKQDTIVQNLITNLNKDFNGEIMVEDTHISLFDNFPYISIDINNVKIFKSKNKNDEPILKLEDIYLGFNLFDIIFGNYDIKTLKLKNGYIHVIKDLNGDFNITQALSTNKEAENIEKDFNIHLKSIKLSNVDIHLLNLENNIIKESLIYDANISFKTNEQQTFASVKVKSEINIIANGDTTFLKHKHLYIDTEIKYLKEKQFISIAPSELKLENSTFKGKGTIDIANDYDLNLKLYGKKKNFNLFIALAPDEIIPTLKKYENAGNINFEVLIKGKSINGHTPLINANFNCKEAYLSNNYSHAKVEKVNFSGHFTNNGKKELEYMEFSILNFTAKPQSGNFSTNILVKNFKTPDIEMTLDSDLDLEFLAKFINSTELEDMHGNVKIHMKFHDIIDIYNPEKTIENFNEAYYTELKIDNLGFKTSNSDLTLSELNTKITVEGHEAVINYFNAKVGNSDVQISGHISDLPAIIHHTDKEIIADLDISSKLIDLSELNIDTTQTITEKINDLKLNLKFISSAKKITESPNLPVGEFFINNFFAKFNHYPHTFHDFNADIKIEDDNFNIIKFYGEIDKSNFNFKGKLYNYHYLLEEHPKGNIKLDFDLTSKLLKFEDLFSYNGENYVPKEYRHEELSNLKIHGNVNLLFNDSLKAIDLYFNEVNGKMKIHPLKLQKFKGNIYYKNEHLTLQNLSGQIGRSKFKINMDYFLGENINNNNKNNFFNIESPGLYFDELFTFNENPEKLASNPSEHENVFNIYELPFSNMDFNIDIALMNYHRYLIKNIKGKLRTTPNHYLYIDTLSMNVANGKVFLSGYFNGSNKDKIYFSPNLKLSGVNLNKILFKFENFGQDYLVSDNISGIINCNITGKIRMHADMTPIIDKSKIYMDILIINGSLINFEPLVDLKDYFVDKNVNNVRFDTLKNHIDLIDGVITIPKMTINSTLGYMVISGNQDAENMEYYIKVPLKLIVGTGFKSLFGKRKEEVNIEQEDKIEYLDSSKNIPFVNIKIIGNSQDFKVLPGKDKKK